jgi:hypothetical protein
MLKNDDINRSRNSVSIKIYIASNLDPMGVCSHTRIRIKEREKKSNHYRARARKGRASIDRANLTKNIRRELNGRNFKDYV